MKACENAQIRQNYRADRWMAIDMMQKAEQVRYIGEMLVATTEELSDQVVSLESNMDFLQETVEAMEERMEEISNLIRESLDVGHEHLNHEIKTPDELPF